MVPNEYKLEKELDQVYIGNMKLYVNLPKYKRSGSSQQGGVLLKGDKGKNHHNHVQMQLKGKKEWREIKGKSLHRDCYEKCSYAEAVRKPS